MYVRLTTIAHALLMLVSQPTARARQLSALLVLGPEDSWPTHGAYRLGRHLDLPLSGWLSRCSHASWAHSQRVQHAAR